MPPREQNDTPTRSEGEGSTQRRIDPIALARCSTPGARELLPENTARKLEVLPLAVVSLFGRRTFHVAASWHPTPEKIAQLKFAVGEDVRVVQVEAETLSQARTRAYHGDDDILLRAMQAIRAPTEEMGSSATVATPTEDPVSQFLDKLLQFAVARGASDLHVIPRSIGASLRLRVNGELLDRELPHCTTKLHQQLVRRLKALAGLDTTNSSTPLDGKLCIPVGDSKAELRLSTMPTVHGERASLRFFSGDAARRLDELGLPDELRCAIEETIRVGEGAILLCGATGSGKTTTLYALVENLAQRGLHVLSLEDPVERMVPGVSQTQVDEERGLTFSTGLRSLLRQDPDVILLGEMREAEGANVALQAAISGHLLLSTLHASSCKDALLRLQFMGCQQANVLSALRILICQTLVPVLCQRCRTFDLRSTRQVGFDVYQAKGCAHCGGSGSSGQMLIVDAVSIDKGDGARSSTTEPQLVPIVSSGPLALQALRQGAISYEIAQKIVPTIISDG